MAAPGAALALASAAKTALTGDLVVVNGRYYRELKTHEPTGKLTKTGRPQMRMVRRLEPIDVDVHVNPVAIAIGAGVALLAGAVGLWWLGLGVRHRTSEEIQTLMDDNDARILDLETNVIPADEVLLGDAMENIRELYTALNGGIYTDPRTGATVNYHKGCLGDCDDAGLWERENIPNYIENCKKICRAAYAAAVGDKEQRVLQLEATLKMLRSELKRRKADTFKLARFEISNRGRLTDWDLKPF